MKKILANFNQNLRRIWIDGFSADRAKHSRTKILGLVEKLIERMLRPYTLMAENGRRTTATLSEFNYQYATELCKPDRALHSAKGDPC